MRILRILNGKKRFIAEQVAWDKDLNVVEVGDFGLLSI
jgi:hypothetical protein